MMSAERAPAGVDTEQFRLRTFVDALEPDQLERHDEPLTLAAVAAILEGNPRAVLFNNVGPARQALAGNVLGSRTRVARAFGVTPDRCWPRSCAGCSANRNSSSSRARKRRCSRSS